MPRLQSFASLLRPLAAPRAVASRPYLRFSTASIWQAEQPPPSANPVAQPSLPPNASSRHPSSPQEAQRAADLAAAESLTEADSAQPPERKPALPSKHPRADNKPARPSKTDHVAPTSASAPANVANTTSALKQKSSKKPKTPQAPKISLPPPKYYVSRSSNKNLPIYTDYKRGGNLHLTTVRKITGDLSALRDELRVFLNKKNEDVTINSLTRHVIVKGHHTGEIADFLKARGF
ncbi:54S ribosomal protein img2, mitochondrial [Curvularia clavata]|uniref:Large ribosomal subunit protein mL49 n=1 Tax=Curvularia clavata TaxID=95742 RepID=A0A9Q8Z1J7_CURCL|nr:54S ribosomal protein img2, mitochondrial [Curvularia clavata]